MGTTRRDPQQSTHRIIKLSGAAAVATGILAWSLGGLELPLATPGGLDIAWSDRVVPAAAAQREALERLTWMVRGLAAAAGLVCVLTVAILGLARASVRSREAATRAALGGSPRDLAAWSISCELDGLKGALLAGGSAGVVAASWARATWPGTVAGPMPAQVFAGLSSGVLVLVLILCAAALIPLFSATDGLRAGMGAGEAVLPRYPTGLRWILPIVQLGVTAGLLTTSGILAGTVLTERGGEVAANRTLVGALSLAGADPASRLASLENALARAAPMQDRRLTSRPAGAATPGAFVGLGPRDLVMAQCGECYVGLMYVPMLGTEARHHAVVPDTFTLLGIEIVEGREFTGRDRPDAPRVAVVNRALVRTVFLDGSPVGKGIRLGRGLDSWYEVIGVVDGDVLGHALGSRGDDPAVYVSALQHPPAAVELFAVEAPGGAASSDTPPGLDWTPLSGYLDAHDAPLRWLGALMWLLGGVAVVLSIIGAYEVMRFIASRRGPELAIRTALGADRLAVRRGLMAEGARLAAAGAFTGIWVGTIVLAATREVRGELPEGAPGLALAVPVVLAVVALIGTASVARSASRDYGCAGRTLLTLR